MSIPTHISTRAGDIAFPAYIPVTTFGQKYPLDNLIRPYLPRLAPAVMVSMHYAKQMKEHPGLPVWIDSGGFASLFKNASIKERRGLGILELALPDSTEVTRPKDVLAFQEKHADLAFTLDFPIPPGMALQEAEKRQALSITNAIWALENKRRKDLPLYACIQGWDTNSIRKCAKAFASENFDGVAIGGMVPRAKQFEQVLQMIRAVREELPDKPIHVFGLGKPAFVQQLYDCGVQSVDSSAYVKMAASGKLWSQPDLVLKDASPMERMHLALCNLASVNPSTLNLSSSKFIFTTHQLLQRGRPDT